MAQQEHRHAGKPLPRQLPPGVQVPDHIVPAAPGPKYSRGAPSATEGAVAQVVVAADGKAPLRQKSRKGS